MVIFQMSSPAPSPIPSVSGASSGATGEISQLWGRAPWRRQTNHTAAGDMEADDVFNVG